ncbi:cysteine-rich motor neuron 1 protein isoform X2 [Leptinotarsa decemlineata]
MATQAAPSIEACPPDSVVSEDSCKCDPNSCSKPPCLSELILATNGSDLPGQCCPAYSCVGCANETMIDGKCPCATGAVIMGHTCVCVDRGKSLIDGKCVCNPLQCPMPQLCNKTSVAVTVTDDCCKKTICQPCPSDSESTNLEGGELEDHCVCLPCKTDCGNNKTVVIKKHGSGFPGNCCDLYECKKSEETIGCFYGEEFYENGKEWLTLDSQICKCNNGLSLCSKAKEREAQSCFMDNKLYHDSESWTREDGCTECVCKSGIEQCISHFCDVKESHIQKNHFCLKNNHIYQHTESWTEADGCTKCTCINGDESCSSDLCEEQTTMKLAECQPLSNCNKTCINGFKINKKGCEICRCNIVRLGQDILFKYNISLNELIGMLDEYKNKRTSTPSISSTTTSTTTTTTIKSEIELTSSTTRPFVVVNRANFLEDTSSTTPEPVVVPADAGKEPWVYIAIPVLAGGIFIFVIAIMCVYKSRRNSSIDLTHCQYHNVNNNNTIKKTEPLL